MCSRAATWSCCSWRPTVRRTPTTSWCPITSDIGAVTLTGDATVPAGGVLVVGKPDGQISSLESVEAAETVEATVALSKPITNGLTYNFTFNFERAGQTEVPVPISAGEAPRREQAGEAGGDTGGTLSFCRTGRLPSQRGQGWFEGAFAIPLLGMPPRHRQMGWPLPRLRHLGHRRRGRGTHRTERTACSARRGPHFACRADQFHRPRQHPPLPHRCQRTRPRAGRRSGARLGDAAGR